LHFNYRLFHFSGHFLEQLHDYIYIPFDSKLVIQIIIYLYGKWLEKQDSNIFSLMNMPLFEPSLPDSLQLLDLSLYLDLPDLVDICSLAVSEHIECKLNFFLRLN
jgi:hypothetical protein